MNDDENLPPEVLAAYKKAYSSLIPEKSRQIYERCYSDFMTWRSEKQIKTLSETVILSYFSILSEKYKPNTLWAKYSMLRSMLKQKDKVDIEKYPSVSAFLKQNGSGYERKKSKAFSSDQLKKFINDAPDRIYLAIKAAIIFGVCGALRTCELVNVTMKDIQDKGDYLRVNIPDTKNKMPKFFTIDGAFHKIVKQYQNLRPINCKTDRFFINYQKEKCTNQPIGKNKLAHFAKEIANFLELPDPHTYTGHCFRRTSATILADSGANSETLKRHGGWKSSTVAEGYIEESENYKRATGNIITSTITSSKDEEKQEAQKNNGGETKDKKINPISISVNNCTNWKITLTENCD